MNISSINYVSSARMFMDNKDKKCYNNKSFGECLQEELNKKGMTIQDIKDIEMPEFPVKDLEE